MQIMLQIFWGNNLPAAETTVVATTVVYIHNLHIKYKNQ